MSHPANAAAIAEARHALDRVVLVSTGTTSTSTR